MIKDCAQLPTAAVDDAPPITYVKGVTHQSVPTHSGSVIDNVPVVAVHQSDTVVEAPKIEPVAVTEATAG